MTTFETYTVQGQFISVSKLVWRRWRRHMPKMAERIAVLNPGLAALGPFLPIGTKVTMPVDDRQNLPPILPIINLWD